MARAGGERCDRLRALAPMSASASTPPSEADLARALAHPLRHRLLFEYQGEGASPSQAARRLAERLNLVSYHTRVLLRHGCVELIGTEQRRGATEHFYRATVPSGIDDARWERVPLPVRRAMIARTLSLMWRDVRRARIAGGFDDAHVHVS